MVGSVGTRIDRPSCTSLRGTSFQIGISSVASAAGEDELSLLGDLGGMRFGDEDALLFPFPFPVGAQASASCVNGQSDPLRQNPFVVQFRHAPCLPFVPPSAPAKAIKALLPGVCRCNATRGSVLLFCSVFNLTADANVLYCWRALCPIDSSMRLGREGIASHGPPGSTATPTCYSVVKSASRREHSPTRSRARCST